MVRLRWRFTTSRRTLPILRSGPAWSRSDGDDDKRPLSIDLKVFNVTQATDQCICMANKLIECILTETGVRVCVICSVSGIVQQYFK